MQILNMPRMCNKIQKQNVTVGKRLTTDVIKVQNGINKSNHSTFAAGETQTPDKPMLCDVGECPCLV